MSSRYSTLKEVDERIEKNYTFINGIKKIIEYESDNEKKCELFTLVGQYYMSCETGIYTDVIIERQICELASLIQNEAVKVHSGEDILIVMSESARVGGHSVIAANWPKWDSENTYSLVLTRQNIEDVVSFLKESINESGGEIYSLSGNFFERAKNLRELSLNYKTILMLTHMDDIIPLLAYGGDSWNIPIVFYNHADFRFSYGMTIADAVLNLCKFDFQKTERDRGYQGNNYVLKFPNSGELISSKLNDIYEEKELLKKQREIIKKYSINRNKKLIISAGENMKFSDIIGYSFCDYIRKIIEQNREQIECIVIGPPPASSKWRNLLIETEGAARAIGFIDREEMEILISLSDLYIVSYPMAAYGEKYAIKYRIPYLAMAMTDRIRETFAEINIANDEEELIFKTNDALFKDRAKYITERKNKISKEEWVRTWKQILSKTINHQKCKVEQKRVIGDMERLFCQVFATEKEETDSIRNVICNNILDDNILKYIVKYEKENNIGLIPAEYYEIRERKSRDSIFYEKMYRKCDMLYQVTSNWLELIEKGWSISLYLAERLYKKIAIYGYGNMGRNLFLQLKETDIEIVEIIDKKKEGCIEEKGYVVPIVNPERHVDNVDVIVNTTVYDNEIIGHELLSKVPMISLIDLIRESYMELCQR